MFNSEMSLGKRLIVSFTVIIGFTEVLATLSASRTAALKTENGTIVNDQ